MGRFLFILLILCGLAQHTFSQNFKYSIRNYSAVDGLPQSQISDLVEDTNGYLWMGTRGGGLARFDGHHFKVYTANDGLLSNEINGLHIDLHNNIWILNPVGVSRFDGLEFKTFRIPDNLIGTDRISNVYAVSDTIFLLSKSGMLTKIFKDSVLQWNKPVAKDKVIRRVHKAPGGEICLFLEGGACIVQGENTYTFESGFDKIFNVFNKNNDVLIRTEEGLFKFDIKAKKISKVVWSTKAYVILYDNKRDIFWTTDGNNLFKETIQGEGGKCDTILHEAGVHKVFIDSEENTWFGSDGLGLYKYFIQDFNRTTPDRIKGVMSILKDKEGDLWLGTMAKGLWKINKSGTVKSYFDSKNIGRNSVNVIKQTTDGALWVGTLYGLGRYEKTTDTFKWYVKEEGLSSYSILSMDADEHGGLWIGTRHGLSYFDGHKFISYDKKDGIDDKICCWVIHYSKKYKTLFIGTDMNVMALTNNKARVLSIPHLTNIMPTTIHSYRDSLLAMSTAGAGILIVDPGTNSSFPITSRDGLASDFNYFVAPDEADYLWIGSEKGIDRIKLNLKNDIIENLHYGFDNGLAGVETNQNAFFFTPDKKYFGLVDGLYEFNDLRLDEKESFELHLTDVSLLYGEYPIREYADTRTGFFKVPLNPVLPPDKNHITFNFNRVDKRYPNAVRFKYILENFDKAWSLPSSNDQVTYGNLPPGHYVFRVMATSMGSWLPAGIAYRFTISTPLYQRAGFIIGMLILTTGLVTFTLYLRVKQRIKKAVQIERIRIKEQETLRKEIARDFHDEMGNQLSRIINYVSLLKMNSKNGHDPAELYGKVETSAKYLYNGTRDFIWSIDPVNDELSRLFIHIRDFGEKIFEEKNMCFRAYNEMKDKANLPYGFSRQATLIFKEAMTNVFKYAEAKNVTLSLRYLENDRYEIILEDDGIGFCPTHDNSNGLKNIRERADKINAVLRIQSIMHMGTKITLKFKLTQIKHGLTI